METRDKINIDFRFLSRFKHQNVLTLLAEQSSTFRQSLECLPLQANSTQSSYPSRSLNRESILIEPPSSESVCKPECQIKHTHAWTPSFLNPGYQSDADAAHNLDATKPKR